MASPARDVALAVVLAVDEREAFANLVLDAELTRRAPSARDAALATELAYGTLRAQGTLDWVLAQFSKKPLGDLSPVVLGALRLGAYQILYLDIPSHAAVNEAVTQVRSREHEGAAGYANAVLRALLRGRNDLKWPSREENLAQYLSVVHWHPRWLVERWIGELGPEAAEALCRADNAAPEVTLRVNALRRSRDDVLADLKARGIEATGGTIAPESIRLHRAGAVSGLQEFARGEVYPQDEASMAVSDALDPQPGETIVDLCAAPGGKATHLAELMRGDGRIIAVDVNAKRLGLVVQSAERLGHTTIETVEADATSWRPSELVDRVLVDAPCSGLGVLARRAEARWRKEPSQIGELAALQSKLLDNAARMVKPGGVLVYSTCTISREENQDQIEAFLARNDNFEAADLTQFLPHVHGTDGIFVAKLRRQDNSLASAREQK